MRALSAALIATTMACMPTTELMVRVEGQSTTGSGSGIDTSSYAASSTGGGVVPPGACNNTDYSKCRDTGDDCCLDVGAAPEEHSCADGYDLVETQGRCRHNVANTFQRQYSCIPPGSSCPAAPAPVSSALLEQICGNTDYSKCRDIGNDCCIATGYDAEDHSCADGYQLIETEGDCRGADATAAGPPTREYSCIPPGFSCTLTDVGSPTAAPHTWTPAPTPVPPTPAPTPAPTPEKRSSTRTLLAPELPRVTCTNSDYSKCRDNGDDCCVGKENPESHSCADGYQLVETQAGCRYAGASPNHREFSCIPSGSTCTQPTPAPTPAPTAAPTAVSSMATSAPSVVPDANNDSEFISGSTPSGASAFAFTSVVAMLVAAFLL